tara:strand:- start:1884 stop:2246 length:363 start_codon:yes stop_codon:yes gene_type:complete
MNVQDVSVWIGIVSSIAGVAVGYGTLNEKVNQLELDTDPTHLESRLTKLETRIEDNDIGRISSQIEQVRGTIKVLEGKVEGLDIPDTSEVETGIKVLETEVKELKEKVHKITNKKSNPLL